jgi:hypothetical protein
MLPSEPNVEPAADCLMADYLEPTSEGEDDDNQSDGERQHARHTEAQSALSDLAESIQNFKRWGYVWDEFNDEHTKYTRQLEGWTYGSCIEAELAAETGWAKAWLEKTAALRLARSECKEIEVNEVIKSEDGRAGRETHEEFSAESEIIKCMVREIYEKYRPMTTDTSMGAIINPGCKTEE